jgi:hypothetical protein
MFRGLLLLRFYIISQTDDGKYQLTIVYMRLEEVSNDETLLSILPISARATAENINKSVRATAIQHVLHNIAPPGHQIKKKLV